MAQDLRLDRTAIAQFCQRWQIVELAFFGAVLQGDVAPDSHVDVLVTFAPDGECSLSERQRMINDLSDVLGRTAEIVNRQGLDRNANHTRRRDILATAQTFYVAGG